MCNLKEKTELKTVTVYKAVEKHKGKYYSFFAGTKIEIGEVKPQTPENICKEMRSNCATLYSCDEPNYNEHMVGKCSGFEKKIDAQTLAEGLPVLKVVLRGEIWIGDATQIDSNINENSIIYAGTEILSFEEI
jgi:hypothetical protein